MKKLVVILGAMQFGIALAAIFLWQELHALRERNVVSATQVAAMESAQIAAPVTMPLVGGNPGLPAASADGVARLAATSMPSVAQSPGKRADPLMDQIAQFQNTPEGREFRRVMLRQSLEGKYPDLAKEMNLGPERLAKVLDLLAGRQMDLAATGDEPPARDRAAWAERSRKEAGKSQAFEAELAALLGSNYPKWKEYDRSASERQREMYTRMGEERIRSAISSAGSPLTDDQFRYLNAALRTEQERIDRDTRSPEQQMQRLLETNRRLVQVAAAHLNPQQLEGYRNYLKQQEDLMQMVEMAGALD